MLVLIHAHVVLYSLSSAFISYSITPIFIHSFFCGLIFPSHKSLHPPQEVEDHKEGKADLRALTEARQERGWEVARPEKRVVHESTKKWGAVDTEDVHETSRIQVSTAGVLVFVVVFGWISLPHHVLAT